MNKIFIVGNISNDVVTKQTSTNKAMVNFNVASHERLNNQPKTVFIPCKAWDKRAEFISSYLKKGDTVAIDGHLDRRSYVNKEGKNVYVTEVIVDQIKSINNKRSAADSENASSSNDVNQVNVEQQFNIENSNQQDTKKQDSDDNVDWINDEEK